jgi:IS5 family transposase
MSAQASFLSLVQHKQLRREKFLSEMSAVIPWQQMLAAIRPHYSDNVVGRPAKDLQMMLKIYFLQQWYNLSDPMMEEEICDKMSFQKFLQIDLLSDTVPDETTILNFRHLLEEHRLQERFLEIVNELLTEKGYFMRKGTIVDATLIAAPSSTKNKEGKRDPEMSQTKKGNQWYFGMKGHIGVDADSGLVHSVEATTAKVADIKMLGKLLTGKERAVFGDKAYSKEEDKIAARKAGVLYAMSDRAKIRHPLSSSQRKKNRKHSSIRSKVEHPFHVLKNLWHFRKVRYRGLKKNGLQLNALFALCNLYLVRKRLLT